MRLYNYLNERETRDRLFREEAKRIIKNIKNFLSDKDPEEIDDILNKRKHRQYEYVWLLDYSIIDQTYDLLIMFVPQKAEEFAIGSFKGTPTLILPIVYKNNPESIKVNLDTARKQITHELIHFLDQERGALDLEKGSVGRSEEDYYNSPQEFNAYYQEAIDSVIEFVKQHGDKEKVMKLKNFDTAQGFINRVKGEYMDKNFVNNLNKKYMRKLDKRLADLYQELKNDGLIKI